MVRGAYLGTSPFAHYRNFTKKTLRPIRIADWNCPWKRSKGAYRSAEQQLHI